MKAFALLLSLLAAPAFAVDLHAGPSCSLMEIRPGQLNPFQLSPGLGVQGWIDFGKNASWSADLALFGSTIGLGTAHAGAGLSLAPFVCYSPWGTCLGPLVDVAGSDGGLFKGFTWKQNVGVVFSLKAPIWDLLHFSTAQ